MQLYHADGFPNPDQAAMWRELAERPDKDQEATEDQPAQKGRTRPVDSRGERVEIVRVEQARDGVWAGVCGRTRLSDLPVVGNGDKVRAIPLADDEGIREPSHFVWWDMTPWPTLDDNPRPPEGLLAIEFNQRGMKGRTLSSYVAELFPGRWSCVVSHVPDTGLFHELEEQPEILALRVREPVVAPDGIDRFFDRLNPPDGLDGVWHYDIRWGPKRGGLLNVRNLLPALRRTADDLAAHKNAGSLWIEFRDRPAVRVGQERLLAQVQAVAMDSQSRAVNPASMYQEIRNAVAQHRVAFKYSLGRIPPEPLPGVGAQGAPAEGAADG